MIKPWECRQVAAPPQTGNCCVSYDCFLLVCFDAYLHSLVKSAMFDNSSGFSALSLACSYPQGILSECSVLKTGQRYYQRYPLLWSPVLCSPHLSRPCFLFESESCKDCFCRTAFSFSVIELNSLNRHFYLISWTEVDLGYLTAVIGSTTSDGSYWFHLRHLMLNSPNYSWLFHARMGVDEP